MVPNGFLRPAVMADLPALTDIYNQAISDGHCTCDTVAFTPAERQDWLSNHEDPRYPLFVWEQDGSAVGYAYLTSYRGGRPALQGVAEISYYLDLAHRGQGIGTALTKACLDAARRLGYTHLVAILLGCNAPSIGLLKKFGFCLWGTIPRAAVLPHTVSDHVYYGLELGARPELTEKQP